MGDQTIDGNTKTQRNAYRISALVATLVFLVCVYICTVPGMYPKDQFLLFTAAAITLTGSLAVGSWGKAPIAKWSLDLLIGAVILLELAECIFGIFKVAPRMFR
ncbi:MAG: hypothetical protein PW735_07490 [Acidobacteriaceae bacterium]|nr:hypothetical protein [Acidobacteriaceae bacterium]